MHKEDIVLRSDPRVIIVSDSPLFLSTCYAKMYNAPGWEYLVHMASEFEKSFPSLNLLIDRAGLEYKELGRFQDHKQAIGVDVFIKNRLDETKTPYETIRFDDRDGLLKTVKKAIGT